MIVAFLATAVCHIGGQAPFLKPDDQCTPGAYDSLSRAQACVHKTRSPLSPQDRRWILLSYSVPEWSGRNGELDHRVPFFLGGTTDRRNIWPEVGRIPNPKDVLEFYVYRRVCLASPYPMRVRTARAIFTADWVSAFRKYRLT